MTRVNALFELDSGMTHRRDDGNRKGSARGRIQPAATGVCQRVTHKLLIDLGIVFVLWASLWITRRTGLRPTPIHLNLRFAT